MVFTDVLIVGRLDVDGQSFASIGLHQTGTASALLLIKGTVRPDWICMRVVSLESPLKGHQPLYVFNFLFLILNI